MPGVAIEFVLVERPLNVVESTSRIASEATVGQRVQVQVTLTGFASVGKVQVWGYTQPDVTPTSETGWSKIGELSGGGGFLDWDTSLWSVGRHAVVAIVLDPSGRVVAHWLDKYAASGIIIAPPVYLSLFPAGEPPETTPDTGDGGIEVPQIVQQWGPVAVLVGGTVLAWWFLSQRGGE